MSLTDQQVAIVRLDSEIGGSPKRGLVLAPLLEGLLCAAFLTSDIPELPMAPLEQPQEQKELKAGCTHGADIPFENAEYPSVQGPIPQPQPYAYVQGPLPQPQTYVQGPLPHPQAQQGERRASLDVQHVLSGELVSGNGELATTAEKAAEQRERWLSSD